ncbi:MAG: Fic family protein [Saprospiraceae bacterium]|nr:Fic family protein [Saprospiraceae bacterium]MCF8250974.1 Fic family protein [Saprospiraceae bacterium]MCF8280303.1 Fic family protein [Bacteroidales bacterium]MCF8312830.1 Fic family protein [Saprospiraceae bacterium]MCF8441277.1 Fic family protein [Saprospiraceae bacterium]
MSTYIHQQKAWPQFTWDSESLLPPLSSVRNLQGQLMGKMAALGFDLKQEAFLETVTLDVLKTAEIEGEFLQPEQVRSSVARHLGMDIGGLIPSDRNVDGVVEMMLDATRAYQQPLTFERLFDWHAALFPTGRSGMYKINVGQWRKDETGPMQVVSGAMGRERVHFQAPEAARLEAEMRLFTDWFNAEQTLDPVLKAGIAHLWFVTVHPFDDGNGRIARAITDLQLSKAENNPQRFYSMSAQIRLQRNEYYAVLEKTQTGTIDISHWLLWFLDCLAGALTATDATLERVLNKARFWEKHATTIFNKRQVLLLNKLLGQFEGKLTSSKWAKIAKCSPDTALRDIQDLMNKGVLEKEAAGGRSTGYGLADHYS